MSAAEGRQDGLARFFAFLVMAAALVLLGVGGSAAAYLALIAALFGGLITFELRALREALRNPGILLFLASFLLILIAFLFSMRNAEDLGAIGDFAPFLITVPAFILFHTIRGPRDIRRFSSFALLGAIASLVIALSEVAILKHPRAVGLESGALLFANSAMLVGFLSLTAVFDKTAPYRWAYLAGPLFGGAAAMLTGSRGPLILFGALLVVLLAFLIWSGSRRALLIVLGVIAAATAVVLVLAYSFDLDRLLTLGTTSQELLTTGATTDTSTAMRLSFYEAGWRAFLDAPLAGHGWWHRFADAMQYMTPEAAAHGAGRFNMHLHNDGINFASGAGVLGLLAYAALLLAPLAGIWRLATGENRTALLFAATVLTVGFLIAGLTDSLFTFEQHKALYCLVSAMLFAWAAPRAAIASAGLSMPGLFTISASGPAARR